MQAVIDQMGTIAQFGFAAVVAFIMIWMIWHLAQKVIEAFNEISQRHTEEMKRIADEHRKERDEQHREHRKEREECYARQSRQMEKFDDTLRMMADKIGGMHST